MAAKINIATELKHGVYFHQYVEKIIEKKQISYMQLESGMIAELFYNKELPNGKSLLKRYIIFVLSIKQTPGEQQRYIYALNLEHILPSNFTRLVARIGLDELSVKLFKAKKVKYPKVLIPETANPKNIYNLFIKPKLETTLNSSYRLFKKENINRIYAVNFNWNKELVNKYLIENKPNVKGERAGDNNNEIENKS